jgi:ABC-type lipoprotein release transport system permease subunit
MALGASNSDVMHMIFRQGLQFALVGVALGCIIALSASRWIEPLLFEQAARDPQIIIGAGGLLVLVSIIAAARPALRASRVNPSQVLQSD